MLYCNLANRIVRARVATALCVALVTEVAIAATPKLESIAVTPPAPSISVGQKQSFKATGTFSDGSTQALGPNIDNIAPGYFGTCVLLTSGGVNCWGYNGNGELGDGDTADSLLPRPVKGINTATALANSRGDMPGHGCALLASGAVKCWGYNGDGELGNGSTANSPVPVFVTGIRTATALALGNQYSCALLASGGVKCWGAWWVIGSSVNSTVPVSVIGINTAVAITAGDWQACALLRGGSIKCWGFGPTWVTTGISGATAVAAGAQFACALLASGAVQCWGSNQYGQLGNGSNADSNIPVPVTGISTAILITVGRAHACAVLDGGIVQCWGANPGGQFGNGTQTSSNTPVRVTTIRSPTRLAAGAGDTCALFPGGLMTCSGVNNTGQLGKGHKSVYETLPVNVVGTPGVVWESSDPSKATITDRGVATGRSVGNATITAATAGLVNDNALLTVK
jgi:alpha-tubulin suppressor-like RCC1 family protein